MGIVQATHPKSRNEVTIKRLSPRRDTPDASVVSHLFSLTTHDDLISESLDSHYKLDRVSQEWFDNNDLGFPLRGIGSAGILGSESYRKNCIVQRIFNSNDFRFILLATYTGSFVYLKMSRSIADLLHPSSWNEFHFWLIRRTICLSAGHSKWLWCLASGLRRSRRQSQRLRRASCVSHDHPSYRPRLLVKDLEVLDGKSSRRYLWPSQAIRRHQKELHD